MAEIPTSGSGEGPGWVTGQGYSTPDLLGGVVMRRPKDVVRAWVDAFNQSDVQALAELYAEDAVNHQVMWEPLRGRSAIRAMLQSEFDRAEMTCIVENLFEDGDWAILEWRDPKGLRGCGFFHVVDGRIHFQRGYWDQLSFLRQQGLPIPEET
jgi:limonene-1,2-epoxide hydrolase